MERKFYWYISSILNINLRKLQAYIVKGRGSFERRRKKMKQTQRHTTVIL